MKNYGITDSNVDLSSLDQHLEELNIQGFTVVPDVLDEAVLIECRIRIDHIYEEQEATAGLETMGSINETNIARCLLAYDDYFLNLIDNAVVKTFLEATLGVNYLLNLQNAIINQPNEEHHQSAWHRDLPYQEYVVSKPIGINTYFCVDEYSENTGSTLFLPFTHKLDKMPSRYYALEHEHHSLANPGSMIVFDSFIFHRAGTNRSGITRRGINQMFTVPIIKQQIDLPRVLNERHSRNKNLSKILGYQWQTPESVAQFRANRIAKAKVLE